MSPHHLWVASPLPLSREAIFVLIAILVVVCVEGAADLSGLKLICLFYLHPQLRGVFCLQWHHIRFCVINTRLKNTESSKPLRTQKLFSFLSAIPAQIWHLCCVLKYLKYLKQRFPISS